MAVVSSTGVSKTSIIGAVLFYFAASIGIVYYNYILFTSTFKKPVFVSWVQQIVSLFLMVVLGELGSLPFFAEKKMNFFPKYSFQWDIAKATFVPAFLFVAMVAASNVCLKFVQISTYQVARSTTLLFNIILSYFLLGQTTSPKAFGWCLLVMFGFMLGFVDSATFGAFGLLTGLLASIMQSIYTVLAKKVMPLCNGNGNVLLSYVITWSIFLYIPAVFLCGEGDTFMEVPTDFRDPDFFKVWGCLFVSGLFAILVNISGFLVLKLTDPVLFNIFSMCKACLQTAGGFIFFRRCHNFFWCHRYSTDNCRIFFVC